VAVDARQLNKRPPAAAQGSSTPEGLSAPLFQSLMQRLQSGGLWIVLDLGAAHSATIRAFGQYRCRLEIVDLAESLDALNGEIDPRRMRQRPRRCCRRAAANRRTSFSVGISSIT
jgi:hypothetical protein